MSIGTTPRKAGPYPGNGVAAAFPFEFKVFAPADVLVVRAVVATGAEATLVLGTHYTVALNSDQKTSPGGTVTLIGGPLAADFTLTIGSAVPATQPAEFTNLGRFYPRVLNDSLDRLTILVQQLAEQVGRSLKIGFSSAAEASPDALLAALGSASSAASAAATTATGAADTAVAAAASAANRVSKTGDTMTGPLTLPGNASTALEAVPLQQIQGVSTNYTPSITVTSASGGPPSGISANGNYRRVGNLVICNIAFAFTVPSSSTAYLQDISLPLPVSLALGVSGTRKYKHFNIPIIYFQSSYYQSTVMGIVDQSNPSLMTFNIQYDPVSGSGSYISYGGGSGGKVFCNVTLVYETS